MFLSVKQIEFKGSSVTIVEGDQFVPALLVFNIIPFSPTAKPVLASKKQIEYILNSVVSWETDQELPPSDVLYIPLQKTAKYNGFG